MTKTTAQRMRPIERMKGRTAREGRSRLAYD
jgi:hypothetical protein